MKHLKIGIEFYVAIRIKREDQRGDFSELKIKNSHRTSKKISETTVSHQTTVDSQVTVYSYISFFLFFFFGLENKTFSIIQANGLINTNN